nr:hypothetical protein [uncultured archaeon]
MTKNKSGKKFLSGKSLKYNSLIGSFYFNNKINLSELASEQF